MKKTVVLFILFFCGSNTYSQNIDSAFKYLEKGRYDKASMEFEKALPLVEKEFGVTDTTIYSFLLFFTGVSFEGNHQYAQAEKYYLKAKAVYEHLKVQSGESYINVINSLSELYRLTGRLETAESFFIKALEMNRKEYGEESPAYINTLNNIGLLYQQMGRYEDSGSFFLKALEISKETFGEYHPKSSAIYNNVTALYHEAGYYEKAELMYIKALEISDSVFGAGHPESVSLLNNLGAFYDDAGNYEKAESLFLYVLKIRAQIHGTGHPDYALSANNLAQIYYKTGNYEKAEILYLQALTITKKIYGEEHFLYAGALNNLGALYHSMGNYEKAEPLYLEALKIRKMTLGERNPDYATSLNNMALLYQETGDFERAGMFFSKAEEIKRETLGEEHPDYGILLNNMALFFSYRGDYEKAETMLLKALEINRKAFGEGHPGYAVSLNNLALFYSDRKEYDKAEAFLLRALKIYKKTIGEKHGDYAASLNNLATVYSSDGRNRKARDMYLRAFEIVKNTYGETHPDYASTASNLALFFQETGNFSKAQPFYQTAMDAYLSQIRRQFTFMSESEKEKYMARVLFFFETYRNFILSQSSVNPAMGGEAYNTELSEKGLLLNSERQLRRAIMTGGDSTAIRVYDSWMAVRASLARQYTIPWAMRRFDTRMMEGRADELEKQLTRSFSINNGSGNLMNTHWQDIKKRLKEGEAAIEFSHFPFFDGRNWTDSTIYAAIILRYDAFYPVIIKLFEARQLESILHRDSYSDFYYIKDLYNGSDANVNMGSGKGRMLFDIIWKPMEKYLDGIRTIYYSPSGRLHQLSFAAIPCGERELLSDKYSLHQLISTAQVATGNKEKHVREVVLYGGVNYDASIMELRFPSGKNDHTALSGFPDQNYSPEKVYEKSRPWMYLEGTLREVDSIKRIAGDKGIKVKILSDKEATEESLKNITSDSCPDVIHFSTHGFFFADPERNYEKSGFFPSGERTDLFMEHSDNPLMRAGLVLAGANYAWAGGAVPSDIDDGILTAYEVSNLYLPNTELVVLSACETGLGEVKGSEGVYGLQRSFKIAGADYILMTLWQIPDSQTVELMSRFYTEWFSGRSVPEALIAAQRYMKHNYPLQPYMWAAFVLIR